MWHPTWLRWLNQGSTGSRWNRRQPPARRSFLPRLLVLEDRTLPSTLTVLTSADSGAGSLRAAIAAAQSGDQIVFDPGLRGQTITLTSGELAISKDLDIEGLGADLLAVSGNHASRVFNISGGVTVTIAGLTITDGLALPGATGPGPGGGIENTGSHLTVADDTFSNNEALGSGGNGIGRGGAIDSVFGATLAVTHCLFLHNLSTGSNSAAAGAINCSRGSATFSDSTFLGNEAIAGDGGNNGFSRGGAIYNSVGPLTVENCAFLGNQALGGSNNTGGGTTGLAIGGAIANTDQGLLFITGSAFTDNQALGGSNNTNNTGTGGNLGGGQGGALLNVGLVTVTDSVFEDNEARGGDGNRGDGTSFQSAGAAFGGAIGSDPDNGSGTSVSLTLSHVTLRHNRAVGGNGNLAGAFVGPAQGGGLATSDQYGLFSDAHRASTTTISDSTVADNEAVGGQGADGGNGGDAQGGGLANFSAGTLTVSGSTLNGNRAIGGTAGAGGNGGTGLGGGLFNDGPSTARNNLGAPTILTVLGSTITDNEAQGGAAGAGGSNAGRAAGGGISSAGILAVLGSSLSHNLALGHEGAGGAAGGDGMGGGLYVAGGTASFLATAIGHNRAVGGDGDSGSNGGNALGGGVCVAAGGTVVVSASTITYNQAVGGLGDGDGTDGLGVGGGVYNLGTFFRDALTIIGHNHASDGNDDCFGC
jgi:hypothetical protein